LKQPKKERLPLVSILITSFNACGTIKKTIESAIYQDWKNKEVIIYDDCSTDGTVMILNEITELHSDIKVIYAKINKGVSHARNQLVNTANGEFVAFFDDDDYSLPSRITLQYQAIISAEKKKHSKLVICHTARLQVYQNGYERYEATMGCDLEDIPGGRNVADRILIGRLSPGVFGSCATCSQMARRAIYIELGGFDESMKRIDDTEFNLRLAFANGYFIGISEPLVIQTMTMGAHKNTEKILMENVILNEKHSAYLKEIGWYKFNQYWQRIRLNYMNNNYFNTLLYGFYLIVLCPLKFIKKIRWCLPNYKGGRDFKKWQNGYFNSQTD
jgi:glycosyltransferase involved in cell wall biosynthesis